MSGTGRLPDPPLRLRVGLSTCPNDTFLFAPLLDGRIAPAGLQLDFHLADVQELNAGLQAGELDVGKASFATALRVADRYGVLRTGSALGFGVGPLLLARPGFPAGARPASVLCPGEGTTATWLLHCLHPDWCRADSGSEVRQVRFDAILPALARGEADAGVAIHEARFTWQRHGLVLLQDLGSEWERRVGGPLPLGGILARLDLGPAVHAALTAALRASLDASRAEPLRALDVMRRHAQELEDDVLWQHVELYVNEHTRDLGPVGLRALHEFAARGGAADRLQLLG